MKKSVIVLLLFVMCITSGCSLNNSLRNRMIEYYNGENYVCLEGTVMSEKYNSVTREKIMEIDILTQEHTFLLRSSTGYYEFVVANYTEEVQLTIGDQIQFVSAPMYFYNGHTLPIVALSKGDDVILKFEEGKNNYIGWINTEFS